MIWDNYHNACKEIIVWDGVSKMPTCSSECMKWIGAFDNNPIGKYMKCCSCNELDDNKRKLCVLERQKVGIVCDIEYNSIRHCEQNETMCGTDLRRKNASKTLNTFEKKKHTIQGWQLNGTSVVLLW